jgi:hypothetical protein
VVSRRAESAGGERGAAVTPGGVAVVAGAPGGEIGARRRAAARGARLEESGAARLRRATAWQAQRWGAWGEERGGTAGLSGGAAAAGASDGERGSAAAACGGATSVVPSGEAATVGGEEERIPEWQRRQWRRGWSRARGGGEGRWPRSAPLAWSEPTAYSTERGKCGKR